MPDKDFFIFSQFLLHKNGLADQPAALPSAAKVAASTKSLVRPKTDLNLIVRNDNKEASKLKHYFVPHEGNGYRPHALHPKRLAFHATSAVVIKAVLVVFLLSLPIEAWLAPEELSAQSQKIVQLTNQLRQETGVPPLKTSQRLEQAAHLKAQDMLVNQYFAHISPNKLDLSDWLAAADYPFDVAGENLAMGFTDAAETMLAWRQSPTHYQNLIDPDYREIGVAAVAGAYQGVDTTMAAQMFGTADQSQARAGAPANPAVTVKKLAAEIITGALATTTPAPAAATGTVLAAKTGTPPPAEPELAPDGQPRATLLTSEPEAGKLLVSAEAFLPKDTVRAQIELAGQRLELELANPNSGLWQANRLLYPEKSSQGQTVIPATLTAWNQAGQSVQTDINANNLKPHASTAIQKYNLFKQQSPGIVAKLFSFTSYYYLAVLLLAMVALGFNIFVAFEKQHPKLIASTAGLISLLAVLILF